MNRRNTIQKDLVYNAVKSLACHPSADEVYDYIVESYPSIGKGTVYRNLNLLSEEGELLKIMVADGADRFDHNCHDHYHVLCTGCDKVFDVKTKSLPDVNEMICDKNGFEFIDVQVLFRGICPNCKQNV